MKKYQRKERALLLLIYSLMYTHMQTIKEQESIDITKHLEKLSDSIDTKLVSLYNKLYRIRKSLVKAQKFLIQRTDNIKADKVRIFQVGAILWYLYSMLDIKKDFELSDYKLLKQVMEESQPTKEEYEYAKALICSLYPDKVDSIEWLLSRYL